MKRIRNIIAVCTIGATLFLASCAKDDNSTGAGDDRDKFTGAWTFNETSQVFGTSSYTVNISKDNSTSSQVIAKNFYQLGNNTNTIIVIDGNNMTIQNQQVSSHTLSGSGSYSNGNLSIHFSADDGQTVDQVNVTAHH